jgi:hypothetical protein
MTREEADAKYEAIEPRSGKVLYAYEWTSEAEREAIHRLWQLSDEAAPHR